MSDNSLSIYDLFRNFWDWSFENPDLIKPTHCAIYSFAIEHCNRLGWKGKFGLPSQMVMEAIGIKSWNTYIKCFNDLVEWGFFTVHEKAKNQYSANIIAISKNDKALNKALDKALQKHATKQREYNNTNIQIYKYTDTATESPKTIKFNFKNSLIEAGADEALASDWLAVRERKKAANTKTALTCFLNQVKKSGQSINDILTKCIDNNWKRFEAKWPQGEDQKHYLTEIETNKAVEYIEGCNDDKWQELFTVDVENNALYIPTRMKYVPFDAFSKSAKLATFAKNLFTVKNIINKFTPKSYGTRQR